MDAINLLKNNKLFSGFSPCELTALVRVSRRAAYAKQTLIIQEGEDAQEMFLILSGQVDVMLNNRDGDELILTTFHTGDIFGELAVLDDLPRSANVIARDDCHLLVILKADFSALLQNNSAAANQVIKYLCERLRTTNKVAYSYALMEVYERLISFLLSVAEDNGASKLVVSPALTHKEIALKICTAREVVSRMMGQLEKDGYITTEHNTYSINKPLPSSLKLQPVKAK